MQGISFLAYIKKREHEMKEVCVHCNQQSRSLAHKLMVNRDFFVVGDAHPLIEGHILIIPRSHVPCIGSLPDDMVTSFHYLYDLVSDFLRSQYGPVVVFEHGIHGQTVFHAHVHFLPYFGAPKDIIPNCHVFHPIVDTNALQKAYSNEGGYLFIEIEEQKYFLDNRYARPRILRDLLAIALGVENRGDWISASNNQQLLLCFNREVDQLVAKWKRWLACEQEHRRAL